MGSASYAIASGETGRERLRVVAAGLASENEVERVADDLFAVAQDHETVLSTPRIVQAWARKR